MKILIACEYSGVVRDAFITHGHDAVSCDILPSESPGPHWTGDVREIVNEGWDMMIAHPPCTYLTVSAEWAYKPAPYHQKVKAETLVGEARIAARAEAIEFVHMLWNAPIPRIAIENPIGCLATKGGMGKASQIIHPHQFGDDASKATCLWLKGLPNLTETQCIQPRIIDGLPRWGNQTDSGQNKLSPSDSRAKDRSKTYAGIAKAMAKQWSNL